MKVTIEVQTGPNNFHCGLEVEIPEKVIHKFVMKEIEKLRKLKKYSEIPKGEVVDYRYGSKWWQKEGRWS